MKFLKKGQAALEFLTTYGWAFLVILVMIGGLSYFGVLDVGKFIPDSCKLDGNLECPTYALGTNYISLGLKNNMDASVVVTNIRVKETESSTWCDLSATDDAPTVAIYGWDGSDWNFRGDLTMATRASLADVGGPLLTGATVAGGAAANDVEWEGFYVGNPPVPTVAGPFVAADVTASTCAGLSTLAGQKKRFDVEVFYTKDGSNIENVAQGIITTTVQ